MKSITQVFIILKIRTVCRLPRKFLLNGQDFKAKEIFIWICLTELATQPARTWLIIKEMLYKSISLLSGKITNLILLGNKFHTVLLRNASSKFFFLVDFWYLIQIIYKSPIINNSFKDKISIRKMDYLHILHN